MGKRKRSDEDYNDFCDGLMESGDTSYIVSSNGAKRPKLNPNFVAAHHRSKSASVFYRDVHRSEKIYEDIRNLITNGSIVVDQITQVNNEVLVDAYERTKQVKKVVFGEEMQEALLFHGTKESNVDSICKYNFDWRLYGKNRGHKFGKGVNFSTNAKYASNYSDHSSYYKVMIVAKVLIGRVCQGYHDMSIPPWGYDTSQKGKNGVVMVKYEDNEFYPAYVLRYHFRQRHEQCHAYYNYDNYYHFGERPNYVNRHNNRDYRYDNWNYGDAYQYDNERRYYEHCRNQEYNNNQYNANFCYSY